MLDKSESASTNSRIFFVILQSLVANIDAKPHS